MSWARDDGDVLYPEGPALLLLSLTQRQKPVAKAEWIVYSLVSIRATISTIDIESLS
jgi:hypothetical protein